MKKISLAVILSLSMLLFTSCGGKAESNVIVSGSTSVIASSAPHATSATMQKMAQTIARIFFIVVLLLFVK